MATPYPTKGSLNDNARTDGLSSYNTFSRNYIVDRPVIDVWNASSGCGALAGDIAGTGVAGECNSAVNCSVEVDTGETLGFQFVLPYDCDINKDIDMRIGWSADEATAAGETANHVLLYKHIIPGTTAWAVPATAFNTNGGAQTSHGANVFGYSPWSTITGGTLTTAVPGESRMLIKDTVTLATLTKPFVHCAQLRYYKRFV